MFARPFEIGDWVEVEDDGDRHRHLDRQHPAPVVRRRVHHDPERRYCLSSTVTNRSKRGRLRLEVEVGVDYGTDVERAADLAEQAIDDEVDEAIAAPSPQIVGKSFGDSAVVLGVRFWIDKPSARRHWKARTAAINAAIKRAFEAEDIKIPYPQRELGARRNRRLPDRRRERGDARRGERDC